MSADWKPVVIKPQPVVAAAVKETAPVIVMPDNAPRPKQWIFIPERDGDLLIVKIIATPVY